MAQKKSKPEIKKKTEINFTILEGISPKKKDPTTEEKETPNYDLIRRLISDVGSPLMKTNEDPREIINYSLAFMKGLKPQDDMERILITQMFGVHNLIMSTMTIARTEGNLGAYEVITKRLCRLLDLFNRQVETLQRYRGKNPQQKVTVEHIHINEGGKAIVGNIAQTGGEG